MISVHQIKEEVIDLSDGSTRAIAARTSDRVQAAPATERPERPEFGQPRGGPRAYGPRAPRPVDHASAGGPWCRFRG